MQHLTLHVLTEDVPAAALVLAELGVFNPETAQVFRDSLPELPGERYRELVHSARSRLEKILTHCGKNLAEIPLPETHRIISEAELAGLDEWLREIWAQCSKCEEALRRTEEARKRVDQLLRTLDNFAALDIDLSLLHGNSRFLDIRLGTLAAANEPRLREAVGLAGYVMSVFMVSDGQAHAVVAGPADMERNIQPVLQSAGWHALHIPQEFHAHPDKVRKDLIEQATRIEQEDVVQCQVFDQTQKTFNQQLLEAAQALALATPYAELSGASLRSRGGLALLSGWTPARDVHGLRQALRKALDNRFVLSIRDPLRQELGQVPSVIRHHRWLRPFIALTANYGVPRYGEIDPTWLFAVTFIAMFGMMFGDIGHGATIAAAGLIARRRLRGFAPFVVASGAASAGFGWLYGSIFGFETLIEPLWISPLSNPALMLTVALSWGVAFILLTTLFTIYNRLSSGLVMQALLDGKGLAGMLFYLGIVWCAYRWIGYGRISAIEGAAALLPLLAMLGYKWHENTSSMGERILVVFVEVFETALNYLAATLSFLRLAAFSLNHVALAIAVFTLAGMLGSAGHWITVVLSNLFIVILEGAIVAIQALRLEYYEGYSRFFSGDGREFRPLRLGYQT